MDEPIWIHPERVEAIHDRQLAEHGGTRGLRENELLQSALARPQHLFAYGGPDVDLRALAASIAHGLAAGEWSEAELADWLGAHARPQSVNEAAGG